MEDKCLTETEKTLGYYEINVEEFVASTINVDVSGLYEEFEAAIKPGCRILDLGSGSGRDSRYFSQKGYKVVAIDASQAMCEKTLEVAKVPVYKMKAEELSFENEFDTVWACASLLHVKECNMVEVLNRVVVSLKMDGVAYLSWKYGTGERTDGMRHYTDYTEESLGVLLREISALEIIKIWITEDVIPNRQNVKWINVLVKKRSL